MSSKIDKPTLVKVKKVIHQRQISNLKKEMRPIQTIGDSRKCKRRRLSEQNTINYQSEYDRLAGELWETNVPYAVRHRIEQRQQTFKQAYHDSQYAKNSFSFKS